MSSEVKKRQKKRINEKLKSRMLVFENLNAASKAIDQRACSRNTLHSNLHSNSKLKQQNIKKYFTDNTGLSEEFTRRLLNPNGGGGRQCTQMH